MDVHDGGAFGGSPLDRLNNKRHHPSFARECFDSPCVRILLVDAGGTRVLTRSVPSESVEESGIGLGWLDRKTATELAGATKGKAFEFDDVSAREMLLLLGAEAQNDCSQTCIDDSAQQQPRVYHFALRLIGPSNDGVNPAKESDLSSSLGCEFRSLRSTAGLLSRSDAALAAHALSLFAFHDRHTFCGICGSRTISEHGGGRRRCSRNSRTVHSDLTRYADHSCAGIWFPRIDPVAIMLVVDRSGSRCLLGRQGRFPDGMWSCLAGFMEHGESIDDSVRREVFEESGIRVGSHVRFFGSQPWPQPYSLMLGCVAQAINDDIHVDKTELSDARWFSREEVVSMVQTAVTRASDWRHRRSASKLATTVETAAKLFVPPVTAIAGQMLAAFAANDPITVFTTAPRL